MLWKQDERAIYGIFSIHIAINKAIRARTLSLIAYSQGKSLTITAIHHGLWKQDYGI